MRIVIPGGSGQVGRMLARHWHSNGHMVTVLARQQRPSPWRTVHWNGRNAGAWVQEIDGADVIVNLAGRSVDCRYNASNRREIKESRVRTTRLIGDAIAEAARPPSIWMNASTATIYRHTLDRPMDEAGGELGGSELDAPEKWRFSIDVAIAWEKAFSEAATPHHAKGSSPQRDNNEPRSRRCFRYASSPGPLWLGRKGWFGTAVRFLDT